MKVIVLIKCLIIGLGHSQYLDYKYHDATNFDQKGVRLMSETLFNYKGLWDIIGKEKYNYSHPKVLICLPNPDIISSHGDIIKHFLDNKSDDFKNIVSIIFEKCDDSTEANDDLLAVIANKPLYGNSEVPTIFYQTPYIYPEYKDHFPNSINLSPSWRVLKYALTKFLDAMQKHRVAIISDDSEYSAHFAEDLTSLFLNEGIMFLAEECEGRHCNFTKALNTLKDIGDVHIVVLNVETKQNAEKFIKDLNNYNRFTWIVRDWPFEDLKMFPPGNSDAYSLSIFSRFNSIVSDHQFSYLPAINEGLEIIKNVYQRVLGEKELFRRNFSKLANEFKPQAQAILARVSKHHRDSQSPVSDIAIVGSTATLLSFSLRDYEIPPDGTEDCIGLSSRFESACAHEALLLLLIVIIMFALLLLVVVVFFNNYRSRTYARFR